jgi:hypothetical protein
MELHCGARTNFDSPSQIAESPQLFHLNMPGTFYTLSSSRSNDETIENCMNKIVERLFAVVATMGTIVGNLNSLSGGSLNIVLADYQMQSQRPRRGDQCKTRSYVTICMQYAWKRTNVVFNEQVGFVITFSMPKPMCSRTTNLRPWHRDQCEWHLHTRVWQLTITFSGL